jgi:hypothetical protein
VSSGLLSILGIIHTSNFTTRTSQHHSHFLLSFTVLPALEAVHFSQLIHPDSLFAFPSPQPINIPPEGNPTSPLQEHLNTVNIITMLSKTIIFLAAAASTVVAVPCKPRATPTLPVTGGASELPAQDAGLVLKKIALGHGIQNYTCTSADAGATASANGALAALYDITSLYPGTPKTGLTNITAFNSLSTTVLWSQDLPLNLTDAGAASPGTQAAPNSLAEASYSADIAHPFPAAIADLSLGSLYLPFIGVHYFDSTSTPTFDLEQKTGLLASLKKTDNVKAPAGADLGILQTGAVDWLRLLDNGKGVSKGVSAVFRVVTAGGSAEPCSQSGEGSGSVPYTAQYWFYGA